jgi:hypothetical protein
VLEPISTDGLGLDDIAGLREQTRSRIITELKEMGRDFGEL